ncbi:MAG: PAS domain S-box protein [Paludibacter sp.]
MKINTSYLFRNLKFEHKITFSYLIFGLLWILFSDKLLDLVVNDSLLTKFQTYKGVFFIFVTSIFLYLLVKKHMQSLSDTESQLSESEYRFNKLYENGPFGMVLVNNDFKFIKTNAAFCYILGYNEAELQEFTFNDVTHPDDVVKDLSNIRKLINKEYSVYKTEKRYVRKDGQVIWGSLTVIANYDLNGQFLYNMGIVEDITERKRIENEFVVSQLNFHRSISESPVGIRIVTIDGKTIYTNKAFLEIYEFDNLEGFTSNPAKNRYTAESYIQHIERKVLRKKGIEVFDYEISIVCKNDKIRHVKVSRKEILWNGKKHFQVINIDITEQRNAESELRKLSIAVEQSPVAICITNPDAMIEYVNPRVIKLTGYSTDELINQNTRIFGSGEKPKHEYVEMWQIIKSGNVWSGELHNKKKNGELYWEFTTISPIFDTAGQITHFLSIKEDITDRKRVEIALNKSEVLLRKFASHLQNVREEEKVAIAREIHDDLGQILVALKIDMGLLKNKVAKVDAFIESDDILAKFDNILSLTDRTIKTSRRIMNGLRPVLLEMNGFVSAATFYVLEFEERHQISCEFISEISNIEMNSQQSLSFFRILQESLNNIAKHSKATLVEIYFRIETNKLILEIIDNGIGFDKNSNGRQDSYGMIGMNERVVLLEGELDIISELDKGTCVRVEIPWDIK